MRRAFGFYLQHENIANHFRELLDCQWRIKDVQKPSNLRRKESKFHVYTLAREGTVSLGVFPHVNLIISSAVQGRLMLCQDTCTDPTGKSVLTPCKAVWQEQDQVREVHRMGDTVSHPYSVLLSTLPRTRKKEKEIKLKEKHNVMQSRFI